MANCVSVFELRAIKELEESNRLRDNRDMAREDVSIVYSVCSV
jgi:hypothetical protein